MIKDFVNAPMRDSGVLYKTTFEKVKEIYPYDQHLAGELAISAMEQLFTGEISSDNYMVRALLQNEKILNEKNKLKYDSIAKAKREKRMEELNLKEIAELHKQGYNQTNIGKRFGVSQQTISKRLVIIATEYPELIKDFTTNTTIYNYNDNVNVNDNVNDNKKNIVLEAQSSLGLNPIAELVLNSTDENGEFKM